MQTQLFFLLVLLITTAWADGGRRRKKIRSGGLLTPRERSNVFWSRNRGRGPKDMSSLITTEPPISQATSTEGLPPTSTSTIESSPSSFFTTDPLTSKTLIMPTNESISKLLFWPPSQDVTVTLFVSLQNKSNFTISLETILPDHWHIIDLFHTTEYRNNSELYIYTEKRTLKLDRVIQIVVSSNKTTYWNYCPRGNICTLLSPLQYFSDSSKATTNLLVPLIVVVFVLIVSLAVLAVVIFHKRSELFHIYAKPVDCITVPPPLPTPNLCPSPRQSDMERKQNKTENTEEDKEQQKSSNKNSLIIPDYNTLIQGKAKETENCLYGLV